MERGAWSMVYRLGQATNQQIKSVCAPPCRYIAPLLWYGLVLIDAPRPLSCLPVPNQRCRNRPFFSSGPRALQLEALFVFLVGIMTVTFFIDFGMSPPTAGDVAEGFSFTAEPYATVPALGLIGAVIMPHNIYLHSALVLSRLIDPSNTRKLWEVSFFCLFLVGSGGRFRHN